MVRSVLIVIISCLVLCCLTEDLVTSVGEDRCSAHNSCNSCVSESVCKWCVLQSVCTERSCGDDKGIYPKNAHLFPAGSDYCPRIAETKELTFASGHKVRIPIKITRIFLYMTFQSWNCKFNLNGEDIVVPGVLLADTIYCESFEMKNDSENPYIEGSVKVLWNSTKAFDGLVPFKVCRCDLEPNCVAC